MLVKDIIGIKEFRPDSNTKPYCMMKDTFKRIERDAKEQFWRIASAGVKPDYISDVNCKLHAEFKNGVLTFIPTAKKQIA